MERMKKEKKSDQNAVAELTREGLYKENKWLWEENKKLREEIKERQEEVERFKTNAMQDMAEITELEIENKNLKAIIEHYKKFEEGKKKLEGMLMEEDTLQELRDIGEI